MKKELFQKYAELKLKVKELETEMSEISPDILAEIIEAGVDKVEMDAGQFIIESRKTWKFSDDLENLKVEIKNKEKEEMATGVAEFEEKKFLKFLGKKQ